MLTRHTWDRVFDLGGGDVGSVTRTGVSVTVRYVLVRVLESRYPCGVMYYEYKGTYNLGLS